MTASRDLGYWAGYRFTPRLIASAGRDTWVMEDHLPLMVRVDPGSGELSRPRPVGRRDETTRGAHELAATEEALWIRWNDGVSRIDSGDGSERWLPLSAASLAAGDAGAWALAGDGRVVRIDPLGGDYLTLGGAEVRRHTIAVGHGAVWTLTWTSVPAGCKLSLVDPGSGRVSAQLAIEGSPRRLLVDRDAVWVRVWRHSPGEPVNEVLVRVDPRGPRPTGEIVVSPAATGGPVLDGVLWASDVDPYAHEQRGRPSTVRRIDATTGHLLGAVEVPGQVTGMTAGPTSVWGVLEGRETPALIELSADGVNARIIELQDLDITAHIPS